MSSILLTLDMASEYCAAYLLNSCKGIHLANRAVESEFERVINGYNFGDTIRIRKPTAVNIGTTVTVTPQDINEQFDTLTLDIIRNFAFAPNSFQLTVDMSQKDQYMKRVIYPAALGIGNGLDVEILNRLNSEVSNVIDATSTGVNSFSVFNQARALLNKFGAQGDQNMIMNIDDMQKLGDSVVNFFNPSINKYGVTGALGELGGVGMFQDQNMPTHTNGTFASAAPGDVKVKTAPVTGATTLVLKGFTASQTGVLKAGDIIKIAGVFAVNPISRLAIGVGTNSLKGFIVAEDVNSDGSGDATVTLKQAIKFSATDVYTNVSALPAVDAVITLVGGAGATYTNNFLFVHDAIQLAIKPLIMPGGVPADSMGRYTDENSGVSMRMVTGYAPLTDQPVTRLDLLAGSKIFPEYCVRIAG